jgi:hypothetical protein
VWGGGASIQSSTIYAETSKLHKSCDRKGKKNNGNFLRRKKHEKNRRGRGREQFAETESQRKRKADRQRATGREEASNPASNLNQQSDKLGTFKSSLLQLGTVRDSYYS